LSTSEIDRLIRLMGKLPGLGPRSARRVVLHLIERRESVMMPVLDALAEVVENVRLCGTCGNVDTTDPCAICNDQSRQENVICVVETVGDLWALERAQAFRGRYHVLGGVLSALDGIGPDQLNIDDLIPRAARPEVTEIILATNATVDGQTTAHYLAERLHETDVQISHLARGVPVGGELDYLDDGTLTTALASRRRD